MINDEEVQLDQWGGGVFLSWADVVLMKYNYVKKSGMFLGWRDTSL